MSKTVSVIIPSYNRAYCLSVALASVCAQTYQDIEIIVVDDASSDATPSLCADFAELVGDRFVYLRNNQNLGAAASRNRALDIARGEFVAFLDSDDAYYPDKIAKQVEAFARMPEADFCTSFYATTFSVNGLGRRTLGWWTSEQLYPGFLDPRNNWIVTPSVMLRRTALERAGMFASHMTLCEDLDLWARVLQCAQGVVVPQVLVCITLRQERIDYPFAILARDELYRRLLERDTGIAQDHVHGWYSELIRLYTATLRESDPCTLAAFAAMNSALSMPFEEMRESVAAQARLLAIRTAAKREGHA